MTDRANGVWKGKATVEQTGDVNDTHWEVFRIAHDGKIEGHSVGFTGDKFTFEGQVNRETRELNFVSVFENGLNVPHDGTINEDFTHIEGKFQVEGMDMSGTYHLTLQQ